MELYQDNLVGERNERLLAGMVHLEYLIPLNEIDSTIERKGRQEGQIAALLSVKSYVLVSPMRKSQCDINCCI